MEFKKYSSIENSYRIDDVNNAKDAYPSTNFVVQEKLHGACWGIFISKEGEVKFAKRTAFLKYGEKFYNYQNAMDALKPKLDVIMVDYNEESDVILYGELIGGSYPHPDVTQIPGMKHIQKEVKYCPDIEFYCFDVKIEGKFIPPNDMVKFCKKYGIFHAENLFEGTLDECLKYPNDFQTTIPVRLGLPEIEGNICEGVVIKPIVPVYYPNGQRIIFKNKNEKFKEKRKTKKPKQQKSSKEIPPVVLEYVDKISEYINENRLRNVLSKLGEVTEKDFGLIMKSFNEDILEDFYKDHNNFLLLEKADQKMVTSKANKMAATLIRINLAAIIGRTF